MNCKNPQCENFTFTAEQHCSEYCKSEKQCNCAMVKLNTVQFKLSQYNNVNKKPEAE